MAVLSDEDRRRCWARLMRDTLYRAAVPADITKPELRAAVDAVDALFDSQGSTWNAALPTPYRTTATAEQKAVLFAGVALRRAGLFRTEEDE